MDKLLDLRLGPFLAVPVCIVFGLVAADVIWTLGLHRHAIALRPSEPRGYSLGLLVGVWHRTLLIALAGLLALYGSLLGFVLFSVGTIWRGLGPGRAAAAGFLAGYAKAAGHSSPALASAFGAGWVAITRGVPLLVLYVSTRAA